MITRGRCAAAGFFRCSFHSTCSGVSHAHTCMHIFTHYDHIYIYFKCTSFWSERRFYEHADLPLIRRGFAVLVTVIIIYVDDDAGIEFSGCDYLLNWLSRLQRAPDIWQVLD